MHVESLEHSEAGSTRKRPAAAASPVPKELRVKRRPAAAPAPLPGDAAAASLGVPPRAPPWLSVCTTSTPPPTWPRHFLGAVAEAFHAYAAQRGGGDIVVNVWSDCAGLSTELLAGRDISATAAELFGMRLQFHQYGACDNSDHSKEFIIANHCPKRFSQDIFARDFASGRYQCSVTGTAQELPKRGLDVYCAGFPCTPWSTRGNRLGWDDKNSKHAFQCVKTIAYTLPAIYILENVVSMQHARSDDSGGAAVDITDFNDLQAFLAKNLPLHQHMVITNLNPLHAGYPVQRNRFYIVGVRKDQFESGRGDMLTPIFNKLMARPCSLRHTWRTFLNLPDPPSWLRLHKIAAPDEQHALAASNCKCCLDARVVCEAHPCQCGKCKDGAHDCLWRHKSVEFVEKHLGRNFLEDPVHASLTYIQCLEINAGLLGPTSPRERNLLNVWARLPVLSPIESTNGVADISQSLDRARPRTDGSVPTLATNTRIWSFPDGRELSTVELALLMGHHDVREFRGLPHAEANWRRLLGNSIHRGNMGVILVGALAAVFGNATGV
jgi:site-specific DNA-cytosine methylase